MEIKDSWIPSSYGHQVVTDDSMHSICELKPAGDMWEQRRRAYLIAAAPDMARALAGCMDVLNECAKMLRTLDCAGHAEMADLHRMIAGAALLKASTPSDLVYD